VVQDLPQIVLAQIVNWFAKMRVIQIPAQNAKQQTIYVVLEMIHIPMILLLYRRRKFRSKKSDLQFSLSPPSNCWKNFLSGVVNCCFYLYGKDLGVAGLIITHEPLTWASVLHYCSWVQILPFRILGNCRIR